MYPPLLSPESLKAVTKERLRLLALFYYISGIITFIMSSFLLLYVITLAVISFIPASEWERKGQSEYSQQEEAEVAVQEGKVIKVEGKPPVVLLRVMAVLMFFAMLLGWTFSVLTVYAGRCISKRKKRTLVLVMAGIHCLMIPYGTLLGIFTFIGLNTVAAKEEYSE